MYPKSLALAAGYTALVVGASVDSNSAASRYAAGFINPKNYTSVGGKADCISGLIPVTAVSPMNIKLNIPIPANQTVVTEYFTELVQIDSPLMKQVVGPMQTVSGTFNISSSICYPKTGQVSDTIQVLTHGVGFGKGYWNFGAPGVSSYSYVDAAAEAGYPSFFYDRLGVGESSHPDPIQVVQLPMEIIVAEQLINGLRSGKIAGGFSKVVGVGHSFGSEITQSLTVQFPKLLDAAVLTGFSTSLTGQLYFLSALNLQIARENRPFEWKGLNNGYLVTQNFIGNQFAFLRAQGFPPINLLLVEATKQTVTLGELFSMGGGSKKATQFTGPIDVVNGINDLPFCQGNCLLPTNLAAMVKPSLYPVASNKSEYYLAADAGHGINPHYSASAAYSQIMSFIKSNGL